MTAVNLTLQAARLEPASVADLGLDPGLVRDLALKTLFYRGRMNRAELADALKLSNPVVEELMQMLSQDGLATVLGGSSGANGYTYALMDKGTDSAQQAIARSGYVGPAPVPLAEYVQQVWQQSVRDAHITRERVSRALAPLVLSEQTATRLGRAVASRKPTLVYGESGNGKSTVVRALGAIIDGTISIPHALEIGGHIVHLFDPSKHQPATELECADEFDDLVFKSRHDRRWLTIHRPVISAGGELTPRSLELVFDEKTKVYEAPLQLKANGGTLIVDDFGRQQIPAVELLNRWIVALEGGRDHLTMHNGQTIEVPFDVLVMFSTNLTPAALADEAFLRRIRYKIEVPSPTAAEFRAIFRRECDVRGIAYDEAAVTHLVDRWYAPFAREPRGCHPRDLVEAVVDAAAYDGHPVALIPSLLDEVCETYFLRLEAGRP